jgi:hypothetical protein
MVPPPVATTLAGPPADPGVILTDTDSIAAPAASLRRDLLLHLLLETR